VGQPTELLEAIVDKSKKIVQGQSAGQLGPVIDEEALKRITSHINQAEADGAKILVDGRPWTKRATEGFWVGPTVILHKNKHDRALHEEIFGPVLSILEVESKEKAVEIENKSPYGNAACVYTNTGGTAEWFAKRFSVGMVGVNVGVPVPREPFSFGGTNISKYGDSDITGESAMELFSRRKKVTTKWNPSREKSWMS